ncbi:LysR family transcriptional regulator [Cupriavidus pauculus]|uniref:LysR family transcriptional regulator n=1 Tax=Cupriavidus pauculus TaxID=82633 RepID=UPI00385782F2
MGVSRRSRTWLFSDIRIPAIDALREGKFRAWEQSDNSGSIAVPPRDLMWNTASKRADGLAAEGPRHVRQAMALPVRPPEVLYGSLPIRHVNTCQLRRFVLMMQFRSASAAERHSGIKAAGILYAVRCIEDRLSTTLFERNGTTMRPTAAAHRLYPCAIRLLEMWDELIAELRPPPDGAPATADPAPGDTPAESASLPASALPALPPFPDSPAPAAPPLPAASTGSTAPADRVKPKSKPKARLRAESQSGPQTTPRAKPRAPTPSAADAALFPTPSRDTSKPAPAARRPVRRTE